MERKVKIEADEDAWAALLEGSLELTDDDDSWDDEDLLKPSEELGRVSRRIAAQYAEVLASFAALAFRGEAKKAALEQVEAAIDALYRLAKAASDTVQSDLLAEVRALIGPATTGRLNSRVRRRALSSLREWIPRFAATLEAEDAERLVALVSWEKGSAPLMDELSGVKGIGPKRLRSLYSAGLYTMDVVANADPSEVAAVTGLPISLATRVVETTRAFASAERRRCLETLRERAVRLRHILKAFPEPDSELSKLAEEAIREVESTFRELIPTGDEL